jgi:hypothetical protein
MSKISVNVIQTVEHGVTIEPKVYFSEELAGLEFEREVTCKEVGFRNKESSESWDDYANHFNDYYNSEEVIFDTMDWEIHWFELTTEDSLPSDPSVGTISWGVGDFEARATEMEMNRLFYKNPALHKKIVDGELPIPSEHILFDREKFADALQDMIRRHDSSIGISWETISIYLNQNCQIN